MPWTLVWWNPQPRGSYTVGYDVTGAIQPKYAAGFHAIVAVSLVEPVGARNGTHKVLCTDGNSAANCEFYNVAADPLEEYPLAKPSSCNAYVNGNWSPGDSVWYFCRLTEIVGTKSFF